MNKVCLAALVVVCSLATGSSNAAIMDANVTGYLNGQDTLGVFGYAGQTYTDEEPGFIPSATYSINVVFDTSLGTLQNLVSPDGVAYQSLSWDAGSGGPSPIVSATIDTYGSASHYVCPDPSCSLPGAFVSTSGSAHYDLTGQSFSIELAPFHSLQLYLTAPNGSIQTPGFNDLDNPGGSLNQPFVDNGYYDCCGADLFSVGDYPGMYTTQLRASLQVIGPSPTPELSTWAMMLLGLFGIGAALRRRRFVRSSPQAIETCLS